MAASNLRMQESSSSSQLQLFQGEVILSRANVMRYNTMSGGTCGTHGTFYTTNFKLSFITSSSHTASIDERRGSCANLEKILSEESNQSNIEDYIPLASVCRVYLFSTAKQKRKRLKPHKQEISLKYNIIEIQTKDMRVMQYDFRFSTKENQILSYQNILRYIFPTSTKNLFAYDFGKDCQKPKHDNPGRAFSTFRHVKDYEIDLSRLHISERWRVSHVNEGYAVCKTLPEYNVCPVSMSDELLLEAATFYLDKRFPVWVWSDPNTFASILISSSPRSDEEVMQGHHSGYVEFLEKCHPKGQKTKVVNVMEICPSLKDVQQSYNILRKACIFTSSKDFWTSDTSWFSKLDTSRWLNHVQTSLKEAVNIAKLIKDNTSVIVYGTHGRDFTILLASLTQIMLDPYFRTVIGFQALIQKDWVTKGHPFAKRLGHLTIEKEDSNSNAVYDGESPLFLLFLDCVFQMLRQTPMKFEFTEQFLILIIDCAFACMFDTFLFNSTLDSSAHKGKSNLMSVWDFIASRIPDGKYRTLFWNPAFNALDSTELSEDHQSLSSRGSFDSTIGVDVLFPDDSMLSLCVWNSYFLRWLPCADVQKGSSRNVVLARHQKQLVDEINYLRDRVEQLKHRRESGVVGTMSKENSLKAKHKGHTRTPSRVSNHVVVEDNYLDLIGNLYFLKLISP